MRDGETNVFYELETFSDLTLLEFLSASSSKDDLKTFRAKITKHEIFQ